MARSRGCTLSLLIPTWVKGDQRPYGGPVVSKLGHARREGGRERARELAADAEVLSHRVLQQPGTSAPEPYKFMQET